jgi:hypothetical protein
VSEEQFKFKAILAELIETRIRLAQLHQTLQAILAWIFIASVFFAFK